MNFQGLVSEKNIFFLEYRLLQILLSALSVNILLLENLFNNLFGQNNILFR